MSKFRESSRIKFYNFCMIIASFSLPFAMYFLCLEDWDLVIFPGIITAVLLCIVVNNNLPDPNPNFMRIKKIEDCKEEIRLIEESIRKAMLRQIIKNGSNENDSKHKSEKVIVFIEECKQALADRQKILEDLENEEKQWQRLRNNPKSSHYQSQKDSVPGFINTIFGIVVSVILFVFVFCVVSESIAALFFVCVLLFSTMGLWADLGKTS